MLSVFRCSFLKNFKICLLISLFLTTKSYTQIKVLNIDDNRGSYSDYTLFGSFMKDVALPKLLNHRLFGPAGIVKQTLIIDNGFGQYNSIADVSQIVNYDIIFVGFYSADQNAFSEKEISVLLQWSQQPGKVLIIMEQAVGYTITKALGYDIIETYGYANPSIQGPEDAGFTNIFTNGPFGNVTDISQGGSSQGKPTAKYIFYR